MTNEQAKKMLKAKLECLKRETSGIDCNDGYNCDECELLYAQGTAGEQKEALDMAIQALEQQPKTGEWRHYERTITCSECDTEFYDDIMEYCGDDVPRFCPHCGARMNGGGEE